MKKSKIISFPNKVLKHLKDRTYEEEPVTKLRKYLGPELKKFKDNADDEAIFVPVKYVSATRYEQYYFLTRRKDKFVTFDLSKLIRIPRENYISDLLWVYPNEDSAVSRFDQKHLNIYISKYRFIHVNDKNLFLNAKSHEERMQYIKDCSDLKMIHRIELANGENVSFSDQPNRFGLVCGEDFLKHMILKEYEYYPGNKIDSVFVAQDVNGQIHKLVQTKLDDGKPYGNTETNPFKIYQQYLFREVAEDEYPSKR